MNIFRRFRPQNYFPAQFYGDGLAVQDRNLTFLDEPRFAEAYAWSMAFLHEGRASTWHSYGIDLRWRAHICVWAAAQALTLEGDFLECGVDTAIMTGVIVRFLEFGARTDRKFFLFDTFAGIPEVNGLTPGERAMASEMNAKYYFDSYNFVQAKMAAYPNVILIRGVLPDTLREISTRKIAYLAVDLNNAASEESVILALWDQLVPGAIVVIDDYGFRRHEAQYAMWNRFALERGLMIAALPTGQGLLVKPAKG